MAPVVPDWDQQVRLAQPVMSLLLICIDLKQVYLRSNFRSIICKALML